MAINVQFCRPLQRGNRGKDVIAHKRAISRAFPEYYPWWKKGFTNYYGDGFARAVAKANRDLTGRNKDIIDSKLHEALEKRHAARKPNEYAFDAYAQFLAKQFCENFNKQSLRDQIVDAAWFWYQHRFDIAYSQARPFQLLKPPAVPTRWDCSAFVANCYYAGGAPDPNNRGYDGLGYTGTLLAHGTKIPFSQIEPADLIFYGFNTNVRPGFPYGAPTHVAIYVGGGMVLSMGSYPMRYLEYDYRSRNCYVTYGI